VPRANPWPWALAPASAVPRPQPEQALLSRAAFGRRVAMCFSRSEKCTLDQSDWFGYFGASDEAPDLSIADSDADERGQGPPPLIEWAARQESDP